MYPTKLYLNHIYWQLKTFFGKRTNFKELSHYVIIPGATAV